MKVFVIFEPKTLQTPRNNNWIWTTDPSGTTNATNGLHLTQLDFTKIGYLMIKTTSRWVILSNDWIYESTNPQHQPSYSLV